MIAREPSDCPHNLVRRTWCAGWVCAQCGEWFQQKPFVDDEMTIDEFVDALLGDH